MNIVFKGEDVVVGRLSNDLGDGPPHHGLAADAHRHPKRVHPETSTEKANTAAAHHGLLLQTHLLNQLSHG